jgi:hypothetical protein
VGEHPDNGSTAARLAVLAARLEPHSLGAHSLSANVIVGQVRSAVVDLLGALGMNRAQARALLPNAPLEPPAG